MNTQFVIQYTDYANYKTTATLVFEGELSEAQYSAFMRYPVIDLNVETLAIEHPGSRFLGFPSEDDHDYVSILGREEEAPRESFLTTQEATEGESLSDFLERVFLA